MKHVAAPTERTVHFEPLLWLATHKLSLSLNKFPARNRIITSASSILLARLPPSCTTAVTKFHLGSRENYCIKLHHTTTSDHITAMYISN